MVEMNVIEVPIEQLIPYDNNPRRNKKAVSAMVSSIKQFGFKNPIIVDENMVIICGHTRRLAALEIGLDKVPVVIAKDMTQEQVRAFRLADNRVASFAVWDEDKLKEEISGISDIDLGDMGFKQDAIREAIEQKSPVKIHRCPKCGYEWKG